MSASQKPLLGWRALSPGIFISELDISRNTQVKGEGRANLFLYQSLDFVLCVFVFRMGTPNQFLGLSPKARNWMRFFLPILVLSFRIINQKSIVKKKVMHKCTQIVGTKIKPAFPTAGAGAAAFGLGCALDLTLLLLNFSLSLFLMASIEFSSSSSSSSCTSSKGFYSGILPRNY